MDGLSAATTVISILQTAWQVIEYIKAVKGAEEGRQKVLLELIRARALLTSLSDVADDVKDDEWSRALQSLGGPDGALLAFKALLEEILDKMGLKSSPKAPSQMQQPNSSVLDPKHSRSMRYFNRSSPTPYPSPKASSAGSGSSYRTAAAKLDPVVRDVNWPFTQPEIQDLLNALERIKTHFLVALSSDNVRLSKLISDQLQTVHGKVKTIKEDTAAIRQHQEGLRKLTKEQELIFQSVSILDLSSEASPNKIATLKKGASALLKHNVFVQWLTDGKSFLLSGGMGSGKTSMCKVVEHYLRSLAPIPETFVVAVYFSGKNDHRLHSFQNVLGSIVRTMLKARPQFQKHYNRLMLTGEGPLQVDDCLRIIHRARQDFDNFYILIDALDQCDDQHAKEIVERLTQLRSPLKIFATSRPNALARHFFQQITTEELLLLPKR